MLLKSRRPGSHRHSPTYEIGALLSSSHVGGEQWLVVSGQWLVKGQEDDSFCLPLTTDH